jgi:hypothetical protein
LSRFILNTFDSDKRGFEVKGLPDGIPFKKPSNYGARQMRKIMECQDDIVFVLVKPIADDTVQKEPERKEVQPPTAEDKETHISLLQKICGEAVTTRVLNK